MKESKAGATSSHTIKAKGGCLQHNRRTFNAPNVIPDKTHLNQSWESEEIKDIKTIRTLERRAEKLYTEKVGQKCQKSFAPYRESVVVIRESSTMAQAKDFKERVEAAIPGIKCVGIWLHKDEGYWRSKYIEGDEDFKCNYHAHYLWYCQNPTTGKAIPIKRADMRKMQDCAAAAFKMERGNLARETRKQWINGNEYKKRKETERAEKISERANEVQKELNQASETIKKVREEKMQLEEAVVKGKAENAKVLKDNKQLQNDNDKLQTANKELQKKKEQHSKDLADMEAKGEEIKNANKNEEAKLRQTQHQLKEKVETLDTIINDGEQAKEKTPQFSYAAFEYEKYIPDIPVPPTFGKEDWVKKQQNIVNRQCGKIATEARKPLISTITSQNECIDRLSKSLKAANKKVYLAEKRSELDILVEEAVKAIIAFIDKPILKPTAQNAVAKAYKAFLKDFFGDSELGRYLIKEANLRIENGVRKQTSDKGIIQACLEFLLYMKDVAKSLLWTALHPQEEREEENRAQFKR